MSHDQGQPTPPDDPSQGERTTTPPAQESASKSSANLRQVVLLVILMVLAAAMAYDFLVARPAAETAYNKVKELTDARLGQPEPQYTDAEIRAFLKRQPARRILGPRYEVDVFQWRAGLPWRTYTCKVVYSTSNVERRYVHMYLNEELQPEHRPDWEPATPNPAPTTGGEPEEEPPEGLGGGGSGGGRRPPAEDAEPRGDGGKKKSTETPATETPATETPATETPATRDEPPATGDGSD